MEHSTKLTFSIDEAAEAAGVGRTLLYSELAAGRLRAKKVGRRTIILADDLESWLRSAPALSARAAAGAVEGEP
ncbi:MAG: helix-turn-helix domain-containing protein [Proteobacteria bacterium]|nr:helix-turn-helix domain-containing protein [Pseudomonadota bacterium]